MARIDRVEEIPIDSLVVGKGQVRLRDVGRDIEELAESIRVTGLLEPIVVAPAEKPGQYEIITGQRRTLAHRQLQKKTILAAILDEKVDAITAKVLSVTENLVRRDLNTKDLIDACTALYKKYGTIKAVIEETGLPYSKVTQYVKYDRLAPELRGLVDEEGLDVKTALRAQDAASAAGELDVEEALKLAKEMGTMSGPMQKKLVKNIESDPSVPIEDQLEAAKSGEKITQIIVTLGAEVHRALQSFAAEEGSNQDDAAADLISEALAGRGFLSEE